MTNKQARDLQRWFHLAFAAALGTYIYSPWGADPAFAFMMKAAVFPALALTGVLLWQWTRLRKRLSGPPTRSTSASPRPKPTLPRT